MLHTRSRDAGPAVSAAVFVAGLQGEQVALVAFTGLLQAELPAPTPLPAAQGFLDGLVLLLGFALPPLVQLRNVPALRVIRREAGAPRRATLAVYALGLGALAALLVWQAGDLILQVKEPGAGEW